MCKNIRSLCKFSDPQRGVQIISRKTDCQSFAIGSAGKVAVEIKGACPSDIKEGCYCLSGSKGPSTRAYKKLLEAVCSTYESTTENLQSLCSTFF